MNGDKYIDIQDATFIGMHWMESDPNLALH